MGCGNLIDRCEMLKKIRHNHFLNTNEGKSFLRKSGLEMEILKAPLAFNTIEVIKQLRALLANSCTESELKKVEQIVMHGGIISTENESAYK